MNKTQLISIIQVLLGSAVILFSVISALRPKNYLPKKMFKKRLINVAVIILILSGNILYLGLILAGIQFSHELAAGTMLLVISCYIYLVTISTGTIDQILQQEITGRKQAELKLNEMSLTDQLTGLHNRKGFFALVQNHLKMSKRQKGRVALLYADINNLKYINDTFGRQEGDLMLLGTANIFKSIFRESDIIARLGSDEFVVFFAGSDQNHIKKVVERLHQSIVVHNCHKRRKYEISIEIVTMHFDGESCHSIDDMLVRAHALMFEKKKERRDHVESKCSADPCSEESKQNFILFINNLSDDPDPFDIKIYIDGVSVIEEDCYMESQHAFRPYEFNLSKAVHSLKVESKRGNARLEKKFEIRDNHVAVLEYVRSSQDKRNAAPSNQFAFNIQDV